MKHTKNIIRPTDHSSINPAVVHTVAVRKDEDGSNTRPTMSAPKIDETTSAMPILDWLKIAAMLSIAYILADFFIRFFVANPAYFDPFNVFPSFGIWLVWVGGVMLIYKRCAHYFDKYRINPRVFLLSYLLYFLPLSQIIGRKLFHSEPRLTIELLFFAVLLVVSLAIVFLLRLASQTTRTAVSALILFGAPVLIAVAYGLVQ